MVPSKNVFVTGGKGFIGSYLVKNLMDQGHKVFCFEGDILDFNQLKTQIADGPNWDTIIHLAGLSSPVACEKNPATAFSVNVTGFSLLLESIKQTKLKTRTPHIIFPSTSHIYAIPKNAEPITESTAIEIKNVYGESKIQGEQILEGFSKRNGLRSTVLRLFNHAHVSQSPDFFIPSMFHQIKSLSASEKQVLVGNLDLYRDFGTIPDLISAFNCIVNSDADVVKFEVFNICSGKAFHLAELAKAFARILNRKDIEFVVDSSRLRPGEPKQVVGSFEKLNQLYGWKPTHTEIEYFYRDPFS